MLDPAKFLKTRMASGQRAKRAPRRRVLILEDDAARSATLESIVRSVPPVAKLKRMSSAEEALLELKRQADLCTEPFDLIIADIFLEGKATGLDFWNACQTRAPETTVLVTSSMPLESFFKNIGQNNI